ncbi:FtsX-like permease family protein [Umezawaea endophytica]|uniref:ABC transporter permease n=1 Tax=Umezawaea endophytica TaxID=1654476 RepID=A0A9X3AIF5_9PSEU|nr:FtsX-like permease family protein [Umezawaea endophytica]MCS7483062.1 ABC transporter permease [Umezawaea endophytica]
MKGWVNDLALGVRIAFGGGRSSWRRIALTGVSVGLGVAVLFVGTAMPTAISERQERQDASRVVQSGERPPGVDPLYRAYTPERFDGEEIMGSYVWPGGPRAPIPPGLQRIPGDGEIVVSPALADLLASPKGELLRPRFPQRVVGTISQEGLIGPNHLLYIAGDSTIEQTERTAYYTFGFSSVWTSRNVWFWAIGLVGVVVLLLPVLVFVTIGTRLAGPERERRLAALRLLGASSRQVRRIATGDALAGSVVGLVLGAGFFLLLRAFVERVELFGVSAFAGDLTPRPLLALLVVLVVPALSVATALVTQRGSVVDPLGVVRQSEPPRRRLWWRFAPILLGAGLLLTRIGSFVDQSALLRSELTLVALALLLLGIPLVLPWVVEKAVRRLRGGPPSWQLAVRRLQMDSGSAARVVGGVAVVLAGGIALQTVMVGQEASVMNRPYQSDDREALVIYLPDPAGARTDEIADDVRGTAGVRSVTATRSFTIQPAGQPKPSTVVIGSCASLRTVARFDHCQDGDAFRAAGPVADVPGPGDQVDVLDPSDLRLVSGRWTLPEMLDVPLSQSGLVGQVLVTPGALRGVDVGRTSGKLDVALDLSVPDALDRAITALGPLGRHSISRISVPPDPERDAADYRTLRRLFLAGTLLVVALAGASLLVLALEQVRTRRRPLAVLAAGGVPRSTLAWSLLWQNAVPLVLAVVVAVVLGSGMGLLFQRATILPLRLDPTGIGVLAATVAGMVLVVTLCTLPAVRRATGATGLRVE